MTKMKITAIIFDLGNVVMTNDWHDGIPEKHEEFSKQFNVSYRNMEKGWEAAWPQLETGKITEDDFWRIFLQTAGAKKIDIKRAKALWRKYQKPLENMLGLIGRLKKEYRTAALANSGMEWLDFKARKYNLDAFFELIVNSGHYGLAKPNPKIYELTVQKLKVDPRECIFIDDKRKNLLPAKKLGMKTILFKGQQDLEAKLRKIGVEF